MSLEYPDFIDPQKAAEGHRTFSGTIALGRMQRLKDFLAKDAGEARFTATFEKDSLVGVRVQVDVAAVLWLLCQRSLEPYREIVNRSSQLGVIEDISTEALLPEGYEAILAEHGRISFLVMVEDELLLALPQVPRNPHLAPIDADLNETESFGMSSGRQSRQQPGQQPGIQPGQKPFAGLADQLKEFANTSKNGAGTVKK